MKSTRGVFKPRLTSTMDFYRPKDSYRPKAFLRVSFLIACQSLLFNKDAGLRPIGTIGNYWEKTIKTTKDLCLVIFGKEEIENQTFLT